MLCVVPSLLMVKSKSWFPESVEPRQSRHFLRHSHHCCPNLEDMGSLRVPFRDAAHRNNSCQFRLALILPLVPRAPQSHTLRFWNAHPTAGVPEITLHNHQEGHVYPLSRCPRSQRTGWIATRSRPTGGERNNTSCVSVNVDIAEADIARTIDIS